jgi:hypothetical protein
MVITGKKNNVSRSQLVAFINKRCHCIARVTKRSFARTKIGIDRNPVRYLLKDILVNGIDVDHAWVCCDAMGNFPFDATVEFDATVRNYVKVNLGVGLGLYEITNVQETRKNR